MEDNRSDHQVRNQKQTLELLFEALMKAQKTKKQATKDFVFRLMQHSMKSKKAKHEDSR